MKKSLLSKIIRLVLDYAMGLVQSFSWFIFELLEIIKTHSFEKKFNIQTDGNFSPQNKLGLYKDSFPYEPVRYDTLKKVINYLKLRPEDVLIDFGCGKGRVLFYMALHNVRKVIGIELDQELIDIAHRNLLNFKSNKKVIELIYCDAANFEINDANVFFMFNPFGYKTLEAVIENIKNSLARNPRKIRIVYCLPNYGNLFRSQDWLVLEVESRGRCPFLIWRNKF